MDSTWPAADPRRLFEFVLSNPGRSRVVPVALRPGETTGEERHAYFDEFVRVESGYGLVVISGETGELKENEVVVIPAGTRHTIINTAFDRQMRLSVVYLRNRLADSVRVPERTILYD